MPISISEADEENKDGDNTEMRRALVVLQHSAEHYEV